MFKGYLPVLYLVTALLAKAQSISVPVILNASETAVAGDVIFLQGAGLGAFPHVQYSYNDSNWSSVANINAGHGYVSVQIPSSETRLPDLLTVRVSADNANWSAPVFMNRARGISIDTDQIAASGNFRIFGRNLFLSQTPGVRFVDQATNSSATARVDMLNSTAYSLAVTAPANIIAGHTYSLYVSNSLTGNSPSGGETLVGQQLAGRSGGTDYWNLGVAWAPDITAYNNTYNVQTDTRLTLHAAGDGSSDDTAALAAAVAAAGRANGGVVYLPTGNYRLVYPNGCGLTLPTNVVLMGAGQTETTINYGYGAAPAASQGGYAVCFGNETGVSDITFNNVNQSGQWPQSALAMNATKLFMQRVTWNIGTSQWLTFPKSQYLTIQNSTITQSPNTNNSLGPLALQGCSRCEIKGNSIQFEICGMTFDGASDLVFENNKVIRDISVAPPQGSVTHSLALNFVTNLTVLNNSFLSQGTAMPNNNDGEAIESEGGGPNRFDEFRGTVTASDMSSLTDSTQNFFQSNNVNSSLRTGIARVAIVSGEGMGQVRTVTAVSSDGKTLSIDQPWDVPASAGSNYATFDWAAANWIVAANTFTGNFKGIELFNASGSDILIQSNVMTDSDGIMISPSQNPPGLFNVVRGLSILNNTISDTVGLRPAYVGIVPREDSQTTSFGTAVLGAIVKGNTVNAFTPNVFINNLSWDDYKVNSEGFLNYWFWQTQSAYVSANAQPPILGSIFQYNTAHDSKAAYVMNTGAAETVIQDFMESNVGQTISDEVIAGSVTGSQGSMVQGVVSFIPVSTGGSISRAILTRPTTIQR